MCLQACTAAEPEESTTVPANAVAACDLLWQPDLTLGVVVLVFNVDILLFRLLV
jgi:hypothetical protein